MEHGAYLHREALAAMAEAGVIWVPTLATVGNLRGTGRYPEDTVRRILAAAQERVSWFHDMGAWWRREPTQAPTRVPHGQGGLDEYRLDKALGPAAAGALEAGDFCPSEQIFNGARLVRLRKGRQVVPAASDAEGRTLCRQTGRTTRYSSLSKNLPDFLWFLLNRPGLCLGAGWYNEENRGKPAERSAFFRRVIPTTGMTGFCRIATEDCHDART